MHPAALTAWADLPHGFRRAETRAVLAAGPTPRRAGKLDAIMLCRILTDAGRARLRMDRALHLQACFAEPVVRRPWEVEDVMGTLVLAELDMLSAACDRVVVLAEGTRHRVHRPPARRDLPVVSRMRSGLASRQYGGGVMRVLFLSPSGLSATVIHRVGVIDVVGPSYGDRLWLTPDQQLAEVSAEGRRCTYLG
ncbi:hypothetical protein [Amycolatopsis sp. WAC 01375]|uniref:hypothetical protein n=1 Tax=Amycolatopsis sp. WAC 01375 TaxID=2203194 RepID=UPI001F315295|nr:hypothetical protein [Amycolatopsis sp. WAC 01375]